MKHAIVVYLLIYTLLAAAWQCFAQVPTTGAGVGTPSGGASYTGPANIVANPTAWWGLRAVSATDRGNKLINVCNVSDVACADLSSDATTGVLDLTTIGGSNCAVVTCTIKTFYDRSGNGNDISQATIAKRFTLNTSCISSLPCAAALGSSSQCYTSSTTFSQSQPFNTIYAAKRTSTTTYNTILSDSGDTEESGFNNSAGHVYIGVTLSPSVAANDNVWHAVQNMFNTTSSAITVDGTTTGSLSVGSGSVSSKNFVVGAFGASGPACGGQYFTGNIVEFGFWPGPAFSGGNLSSMNSNIHAFWGF